MTISVADFRMPGVSLSPTEQSTTSGAQIIARLHRWVLSIPEMPKTMTFSLKSHTFDLHSEQWWCPERPHRHQSATVKDIIDVSEERDGIDSMEKFDASLGPLNIIRSPTPYAESRVQTQV